VAYIKGPTLVRVNFERGTAHRYLRRFDMSGAGLGWQVKRMERATFDVNGPLPAEQVERFRVTGA